MARNTSILRSGLLALTAALAGLVMPVPAAAAEPITGRWVTQSKDAVVGIARCGKSLCGRIERFLIKTPQGADQRDTNNPDAALRQRKLVGLAILSGLSADGEVWRGEVYDPKTGRTYRSEVRRKSADILEVSGCLGPFCQTQVWKKAS